MSYQHILYAADGGVARLTLNRPDRLNSFNDAMHAEVRDALSRVKASADMRVLLLTGARGFAQRDGPGRSPRRRPVDLGASIRAPHSRWCWAAALPLPVVCGVNGVAGAGATSHSPATCHRRSQPELYQAFSE
jgi:2-(1,2-epoxy-1,2-dihydrophenyl)acetyl-CoA isomerase